MELLTRFAVTARIRAATRSSIATRIGAILRSAVTTSVRAANIIIARTAAVTSTGIIIIFTTVFVAVLFVIIFRVFDVRAAVVFPIPFESGVVGIEILLSCKQIICQCLVNLDGLTSAISDSDDISTIRSDLAIGAPNYVDFITGLAGIDNPLGI